MLASTSVSSFYSPLELLCNRQIRLKREPAKKAPMQQYPEGAVDFRVIAEEQKQKLDKLLLDKNEYM